ncbi:MAG TPA: DUF4097 family beta strand repeat-containing protein [Longimicrobiaceae bacterium]|jgi:hypothetical protein|nr:DUF4097 family beta strand repeat-containing protein [Longimicrobiaceae bacterium]
MTLSPSISRAFVLAAAGPALFALPAAAQRFTLAGDRAAFYNLAGEVRVEAGQGAAVVVEVTRAGDEASKLRVEQGVIGGAQTLRVVYPDADVIYPRMGRLSRSSLRVRSDGTFGGDSDDERGGWSWGGRGGREVTIAGWGSGTHAYADARVLVPAGRSVSVNQGVGRVTVANVNGTLRVRLSSGAVETNGTSGSLDVGTGSGGARVANARGAVRVSSGSGGLRVDGIRGTTVELNTGSGGINGSGIEAADLRANAGSGGITLAGVAAERAVAHAGSGHVRLDLRRDAADVRIATGSGGVTLGVPADFGAELSVVTGSGGVSVGFPVTARRSSRHQLEGTIGDGRGRVEIRTGSGGVQLVRS